MRCGEAFILKWTDFDFENKTVNITTEKGSEPRQLKISPQLISMLNGLPKKKEEPFACSSRHFKRYFRSQRANVANKLKKTESDKSTSTPSGTGKQPWNTTKPETSYTS
jgi:integrase